ncbi:MAG: ECF transporter S component [Candidatus Cloacimonadota bacterium]|jgi:uncharacterized membrane protein|nr:ECF transporter S component [Candidatus Cloacimonadota bacterium]
MKWYLLVGLTVLVTVCTLLVRIPFASSGYFNIGDVMIVFSALYAGRKAGAVAGGIGSAIADLIGFPIYTPITLIVKGLEGFICGLGHGKKPIYTLIFPLLGTLLMVGGYFLVEWMIPQFGKAVAFANLPGNLIQAAVGLLGGKALFEASKLLGI